MNLKELIAQAYEAHIHDHTATADFEACSNPLCQLAYAAEARVGELEQERDELNKIIPFVLRHYDDIDDEFTESFYVNADYKIVDPSKTDEWKYLLTLKQIANRRLEKLSAALAKGAK